VAETGDQRRGEQLRRRGEELLDEAAGRSRVTLASRVEALRTSALTVAQCALAAAAAWYFATEVVHHPRPFFAPIAAVIALAAGYGQRGRRTVELVVGVSLGVAVGDLLIAGIGTGTLQVALVVALAMTVAIAVGGGPLLITQSAVSGVLVATLQPPSHGIYVGRALDALIGGTAALAVNFIVPVNPVAILRRTAEPIISELAATLEDVADALAARDMAAAERALARARAIDTHTGQFREAIGIGRETVRLAPPRRGVRESLALYEGAAAQLDLAVRNVRVLARGAIRALLLDERVPPELGDALRDLATAVRGLGRFLAGEEDAIDDARAGAIRAAGDATHVLEQTGNLSVSVIVGQVRSTAVDLLRGLGMDRDAGREAVRESAGPLDDEDAERPV
jgi:Fusaric acid resistance protein-like